MEEKNEDKEGGNEQRRWLMRGEKNRLNAIEEMIQEAMEAGEFDNLAGQGKPLKLEKNPFAEDKELAYKLLKDNDYTLPWIADRLETLDQVEAVRAEIGRAWQIYREELGRARSEGQRAMLEHSWRRMAGELQTKVEALNKRIGVVNLSMPSEKLEIIKLKLEREIKKLEAEL